MSFFDKDERLLLPEWLKTGNALNSYEVKPFSDVKSEPLEDNTDMLYEEFSINKSLDKAIELLNISFIENREAESRIAAKYVVQGFDLPPQILNLAKYVLKGGMEFDEEQDEKKSSIGLTRDWLRENPKDTLGWLDLAREYAAIGKMDAAEKAITVSLNLQPHHRLVVRNASRFFVNRNQNDIAHKILLKHPNLKEDPWLLSAEIAVAESYNRPQKLVNHARRIIDSRKYAASHLTELESSIATLELSNGLIKKARKLYVSSLEKPTDNSLAQAKWAERSSHIPNLVSSDLLANHQGAYEAKFWEKYYKYEIPEAIELGLKWFNEEPYSVQPAIMVSYLASLLDDYVLCLRITKLGLNIDKNNEILQLNKVFSELCLLTTENQNEIDEFFHEHEMLLKFLTKKEDKVTVGQAYANLGLLHYKANQPDLGREYYDMASETFAKIKSTSYLVALMNHYRESVISKSPWADELFDKMSNEVINFGSKKEPAIIYYFAKMSLLKENPLRWEDVKTAKLDLSFLNKDSVSKERVVSFDYDPKNPTITISKK